MKTKFNIGEEVYYVKSSKNPLIVIYGDIEDISISKKGITYSLRSDSDGYFIACLHEEELYTREEIKSFLKGWELL